LFCGSRAIAEDITADVGTANLVVGCSVLGLGKSDTSSRAYTRAAASVARAERHASGPGRRRHQLLPSSRRLTLENERRPA